MNFSRRRVYRFWRVLGYLWWWNTDVFKSMCRRKLRRLGYIPFFNLFNIKNGLTSPIPTVWVSTLFSGCPVEQKTNIKDCNADECPCETDLCVKCLSTKMIGSVKYDSLITNILRGNTKEKKIEEILQFGVFAGSSCDPCE